MTDTLYSQCDFKVHELLVKIHQRLNQKFPFIQQSRQLSLQENQLLGQIEKQSVNYKILVATMAIDTYTDHIGQIFNEADSLLQTLSICLSCAQKMKSQIGKSSNKNQLTIAFNNLYTSLISMSDSASLFNPHSPYLELYRSVIANQAQDLPENIYSSLKEQNSELKERLKSNDNKIVDLEIKLTKILQEHEGCENGNIEGTLKTYEVRQQLQKKQLEIQKMNEDFSYEIEKYNLVYETLKKQLEDYKSYESNIHTVELIEKLQTEIVVLRQQKQREQMINQELRHRLQILSQREVYPSERSRIQSFRREDYAYPSHGRQDLYREDIYQYEQIRPEDYYYSQNPDHQYVAAQNVDQPPSVRSPYTHKLYLPNRHPDLAFNGNVQNGGYRY